MILAVVTVKMHRGRVRDRALIEYQVNVDLLRRLLRSVPIDSYTGADQEAIFSDDVNFGS